ncbi:Homocysteine S-methyltransferase [Podospora appendiculata]|uniref:Homocysteine S-methyltransferase n=1 Tax=Podospora appendiculata TaxID=314037 RepID=A0AAE0XJ79_9PEZI|nr:Homocysteine S-methyltransferase [Podospora appendiculata]
MRNAAKVLILDGGLGTSLEDKYHVNFAGAKTPLWSCHLLLSDQPTLLACQSDFGEAGADIITTATYQASIDGFSATQTADWPRGVSIANIGQFLEDAVLIANKAAQSRIPGSGAALALGPYGATMVPSTEYSGKYDMDHGNSESLANWHMERFLLFAKVEGLLHRIRYVAFETIPRLDEIMAIRKVLEAGLTGRTQDMLSVLVPVWISCVFPADGDKLPDGSSVEDVVAAVLSNQFSAYVPWGIGINCTKVGKLASLVARFEKAVNGLVQLGALAAWPSLVLYPDGTNGEVYNTATKAWELPDGQKAPETPWEVELANVVEVTNKSGRWRSIVVGGCCKTSDSDIARLRKVLVERGIVEKTAADEMREKRESDG